MTHVAVVVNPSKFDDLHEQRRVVEKTCARHGVDAPLWLETTEEDPGGGQAREALSQGAELVCAFGGDGTVRAVAEVLAGTDVPLGLLPGGTGNLLARALELVVHDVEEALDVALTGRETRIDVGTVRADGGDEQVFVVMAGMGLDAETMERTDERLKAALGWLAYVAAGVRAAVGGGFTARVQLAGGTVVRRAAKAVVVGNSGRLQGGLELMPDAAIDDGLLDLAVVAPRGVVGWARTLWTVATAGRDHRHLELRQAKAIRVRANTPTTTQLDGDTIGVHRELEFRVRPGALVVRVGRVSD